MSDILYGALIGVFSVLGGAIVTQIGSFVVEKRRELASYRVNLYAKRLEVHQQAFEWLMRVLPLLTKAKSTLQQRAQAGRGDLLELCEQADAWWDANCLYLDQHSRWKFQELLIECGALAHTGTHRPLGRDPEKVYEELWLHIQRGIGEKHIDERLRRKAPVDDR